MALISCPECKKEISDEAASCPYCGYQIAKRGCAESPPIPAQSQQDKRKRNASLAWLIAAGGVLLASAFIILASVRKPNTETPCDGNMLLSRLRAFRENGLLHKIDYGSVPRIYVGDIWYNINTDYKKGAAYWLVCETYGGKTPSDALVKFHDWRSGEEIAEWGASGFRVFR